MSPPTLAHDLDVWTWELLHAGWSSLGNGTALVLITAALLAVLGRRVPAGVQAALWTLALAKFVLPCGPALIASLSHGLQIAGEPMPKVHDALWAHDASEVLAVKVLVSILYLSCVAWLGGRAARRYRGLLRAARALPPAGAATRELVAACARRLGVRAPDVRVSPDNVSPHVCGVLRPVLVMPRWLEGRGEDEESFVLHELAHLARRDHWLLLGILVVETLFFFWPPVRFAASRLRSAREAACDATAVTVGPLGAAAYARSLVGAARTLAPRPAGGVVLGGVCTRLEERIDFLLRGRRAAGRARRVCVAAAVLLWSVWALGGGMRPEPDPRGPCTETVRAG
jgi:beta-lactamase regulating signal transducer with metallopeptidase domain